MPRRRITIRTIPEQLARAAAEREIGLRRLACRLDAAKRRRALNGAAASRVKRRDARLAHEVMQRAAEIDATLAWWRTHHVSAKWLCRWLGVSYRQDEPWTPLARKLWRTGGVPVVCDDLVKTSKKEGRLTGAEMAARHEKWYRERGYLMPPAKPVPARRSNTLGERAACPAEITNSPETADRQRIHPDDNKVRGPETGDRVGPRQTSASQTALAVVSGDGVTSPGGENPALDTRGESSDVRGIAAFPRPSSEGRTPGPGNPAGEGEPSVKHRAVTAGKEVRPDDRSAPSRHTVPVGGRPTYRREPVSTAAVRPAVRERYGLGEEALSILQLKPAVP